MLAQLQIMPVMMIYVQFWMNRNRQTPELSTVGMLNDVSICRNDDLNWGLLFSTEPQNSGLNQKTKKTRGTTQGKTQNLEEKTKKTQGTTQGKTQGKYKDKPRLKEGVWGEQ